MRPDTSHWQGRSEELGQLQQWLHTNDVRLIGVTATGGYGKSALVAKLCDVAADFPQQLWVSFSDAYPFAVWGRWLLDELNKPAPEKPEDLLIAVCHCLQTEKYLLVLDNLETLLQDDGQWHDEVYAQFWARWFGSSSESKILLTSREQPTLPNNTLNQSRWLPLGGLDTDAGVALLQALEIQGLNTNLVEFVHRVDGHPLLLKLVAGLLKAEEGEAADINVLKQDIFQILGLHRDNPEASIAKILDASLRRLEPKLKTWLQNLSVYRLPFDCCAAKDMSSDNQSNDTELELQLRQLAKRSLLQEKKQQGVWKFSFQPLIQSYLQKFCSPAAHQCAIAYYEQHRKPELTTDKLDEVAEYLEIFHHLCELGQYHQAFASVYYRENNHDDCDEFLKRNYYFSVRLTLYERLYQQWQQPENSDELRFYSDFLKVYGDVLQFLDRRDEALQRYESALQFYRDIGDRLGEANTLIAIGDVLQFLGRSEQALQRYESALQFYRDIGARLGEANTLKAIGDVLQFLDRRDEALQRYERALQLYRDIGDRLGEANTLKAIGDVLQFLKRSEQALQRYESALQFYRDIGARLGEANTLIAIGDVLQFLKRSEQALQRYERALQLYRDIGDRLGEANTLQAIGDVLQFLGRSEQALQRYESALQLYRDIGDRLGEANTLRAIGDVLQFLKRSEQALQRYESALQLYRDIGDRLGEANTLRAIGDVLQFLKRSEEALQRYESALQFYRDIGARLGEANTLKAIGDVLQFLKRSEQALQRYESALQFYRDIGARLGEANTLIAIGDVLQFLDRRDEALQRYESALQFYRDIGDRLGEANVLQEFGKLQENPTTALDYLQQAQNLYIQIGSIYNQSRNLLFIADVQLKMGGSNAAINSLNHAAQLATTINYAPIQEYAQTRIAEINSSPAPTNRIKEKLIQFIQHPWVKFALCFLVGLIAFILLRR
ncbi:tetratricopeptide repeat protein [Nostoc sp. FACHB-857]|uniref:tetratricopeptide repeat protein n=1 Tax=Nostoc sp. FACHB-857 TaxID=2692840 RepID=UPI0024122978|nr:tetratricopeptide repeat protein [Nostoc sp. FACHB-857]